ncbi:nitrite reductase (NADH) small subunit [Methylomarinovum tepidoasis]|uniref:Nitrite reductase (NADH) small subunit n=1 Tax=Methylomarinovum tepidoasis TaxID=2840183 RepID=A0AAU9C885_9GAMM|nr:nitrite reductase small subunit NirD [Methylomarinovum sp. IN45]BCX88046.1 nitrite reductase (NADH) small subunit [Methylomarinovum sp. IN45]
MTVTTMTETWIDVCRVEDLEPDAGICALVEGHQVAIFYLPKLEEVFAIGNYDPFSHANVLSRGLTGDIGGEPVVASPVYKQHFNLRTGRCLEDKSISVPCYPARITKGRVQIQLSAQGDPV